MNGPGFALSQDLVNAAEAEMERIYEAMAEVRARRLKLSRELEAADQEFKDLARQLSRLGDMIGVKAALEAEAAEEVEVIDGRQVLRGARIREEAIRVLLQRPDPTGVIHYREWLALIEQAGFHIAGRDPGAVLLTQVSRSPLVSRAPESGRYQLDRNAMARLRERHAEVEREMRAVLSRVDEDLTAAQISGEMNRLSMDERRIRRQMEELRQTAARVGAEPFFGLERSKDEDAPPPLRVAV